MQHLAGCSTSMLAFHHRNTGTSQHDGCADVLAVATTASQHRLEKAALAAAHQTVTGWKGSSLLVQTLIITGTLIYFNSYLTELVGP